VSAHATASLNPESKLITQAQNGDPIAFAVLYEAHRPRIQAVCLRMTNNIAEAEDLTQDAFIYVFRKLSTFRGDSAFSTWVHRVAVNTVLMHFRRKGKRQVSLEQPHPQETDGPKREFGRIDERLAGCADRLALAEAIDELPPGYRAIFLLHEVQGFEHQEIARRLHCSIGNSKSQLHKAKLRLRELLAPRGYTCRQKAGLKSDKALASGPRIPIEVVMNISAPVSTLSNASLWLSNPLLETEHHECESSVSVPSDIGLSSYKKKLTRRPGLIDDRAGIGNPEVMLPAIRQASPTLMAESGS
jgi:RNA polymerase sigma-70 factor (ECF subfamily)